MMKKSRVELPEDLVTEILCKLPVKSLLRFRSVCKYWCSCLQNPSFISKHHQNNLENNNLNLLLRCHRTSVYDPLCLLQLSTKKDDLFRVEHNIILPVLAKSFHVHSPCHGILCLYDPLQRKTALWNPSTRELKILPPSPSSLVRYPYVVDYSLYLSFGFGFDSKTGDYKHIRLGTCDETPTESTIRFQIHELYSLKSDSWKDISHPYYNDNYHVFPDDISLNNHEDGCCYWIATTTKSAYDKFILSFDFVKEKFSTLPFPKDARRTFHTRLSEFNGSLGLIVHNSPGRDEFFELWVMKGGEWSKRFSIVESIPGFTVPLGFWKNGELFYQGRHRELLLFDASTREVKKLGINASAYTMELVTYFESLVPINGGIQRSEHVKERIKRQPEERKEEEMHGSHGY